MNGPGRPTLYKPEYAIVVCRGEIVKVDHTVHLPPYVQAGVFWLRNRPRPSRPMSHDR
jgi:hypothetical protein